MDGTPFAERFGGVRHRQDWSISAFTRRVWHHRKRDWSRRVSGKSLSRSFDESDRRGISLRSERCSQVSRIERHGHDARCSLGEKRKKKGGSYKWPCRKPRWSIESSRF